MGAAWDVVATNGRGRGASSYSHGVARCSQSVRSPAVGFAPWGSLSVRSAPEPTCKGVQAIQRKGGSAMLASSVEQCRARALARSEDGGVTEVAPQVS